MEATKNKVYCGQECVMLIVLIPATPTSCRRLAEVTRSLDPTLPITFANHVGYSLDLAVSAARVASI